jgi:hypothetical protein
MFRFSKKNKPTRDQAADFWVTAKVRLIVQIGNCRRRVRLVVLEARQGNAAEQ